MNPHAVCCPSFSRDVPLQVVGSENFESIQPPCVAEASADQCAWKALQKKKGGGKWFHHMVIIVKKIHR